MNKKDLKKLLREWIINDFHKSNILEADYFKINEIKIDENDVYNYKEIDLIPYSKAWEFDDRCGNKLVAVFTNINEFKSGYKVEGFRDLVFDPKIIKDPKKYIRPCPDGRKINTIYKILVKEILPKFILNKKPSKLYFNPISPSRNRLVDIIINKIIKQYPHLIKNTNYIINK